MRITYTPGEWYHVMNRGRRREVIFPRSEDREAFLRIVMEAVETWNFKMAAYCLMANHYLRRVQTPEGNISRCMRHVNAVYTRHLTGDTKKDGQLFRGRSFSPIERYFLYKNIILVV